MIAKKIGNPTSSDLNRVSELCCLFIDRNLSIAIETVVYIDPTLAICTNPRLKMKWNDDQGLRMFYFVSNYILILQILEWYSNITYHVGIIV